MKDKEVFPMFRRIALLFCILVLTAQPALAAKARGIASDADSDFHAAHLALHTGGEDCSATGNYIKTYRDQARKKLVGHLEIADTIRLLAVENGMAQIEVLVSDSTSPDSYEGMTGSDGFDLLPATKEGCEFLGWNMAFHNKIGSPFAVTFTAVYSE